MNERQFEAAVERLKAVNAVIEGVDPAIRSDAFKVLEPYVAGRSATGDGDGAGDEHERTGSGNGVGVGNTGKAASAATARALDAEAITQLVEMHEGTNATDNGVLVTAIFYSVYGRGPFEPKDFKTFADRHAMIWPNQYHKAVARRKYDGNAIVRKARDGWYVTTAGEAYFRETYGVKRGNQSRSE
jgi:hypothetical protein